MDIKDRVFKDLLETKNKDELIQAQRMIMSAMYLLGHNSGYTDGWDKGYNYCKEE